ncbi:MAG: reverse transcriptase N-terminal domain-containing protein [Pseudomonadota bacterium]
MKTLPKYQVIDGQVTIQEGGHCTVIVDWNEINWNKVRRSVLNLQKRIYKAAKSGNYKMAPIWPVTYYKYRIARLY